MTPSIEERVAAGAAWLDEHEPGWERKIDLAKLDLVDSCRCVLGQLWGDFDKWTRHVVAGSDLHWPSRLGFDIDHADTSAAWPVFDEAWISLLKDRFDSGNLSDDRA